MLAQEEQLFHALEFPLCILHVDKAFLQFRNKPGIITATTMLHIKQGQTGNDNKHSRNHLQEEQTDIKQRV
jgi:hypothetical protein